MSFRGGQRGQGQGGRPSPRGNDRNRGSRGDRGGHYGGHSHHGGQGGGGRGGRGGGKPQAPVEVFNSPVPAALDGPSKAIEDRYDAKMREPGLDSLSLDRQYPLRPGYGTRGDRVLLWANYFALTAKPNVDLYRYKIEVKAPAKTPEPKGKKLKRIIELLLEDHFQEFRDRIATDFKATLICRDSLKFDSKVYDIQYRAEGEDTPPPNPKVYPVRVLFTGTLSTADLLKYLSSVNLSEAFGGKEELLQALNIIVGHNPKTTSNMFSVGANRHYPLGNAAERYNLQGGLEAFRGYFVSVRPATGRLLVNVQVKHIACFAEVPLARLIEMLGARGYQLQRTLKGIRVQLSHLRRVKGNQRIPRVKTIIALASPQDGRGLDHPPRVAKPGAGPKNVHFYLKGTLQAGPAKATPQATKGKAGKAAQGGDTKDHGYISVYDYFKRMHNVGDMNEAMPVVNVGTSQNPSYLPVEVCRVEPGQTSKSKLTPRQTRSMIDFAVRKPAANAKSITERGTQVIAAAPNTSQLLSNMGLSISPNLITVGGRVLTGPNVRYKATSVQPKFASWNLSGVQFPRGASLSQWTFLFLRGQQQNDKNPRSIAESFRDVARKHGMTVSEPLAPIWLDHPFTSNESPESYAAKVDRAFDQLLAKHRNIRFLLVMLPFEDSAIYNRVKFRGDIQNGIHTVCVGDRTGGIQSLANIALKFNLKLGGANHVLDPPKLGLIGEGKTMLVGIDVTHPSPGSSSQAPSVAAMVASVDKDLAQWPASIRLQREAKAEMVDELEEMLESRLQLWKKYNNAFPENIIVYRDGVSEGQYTRVLEEELPRLRKACERVYPATLTKNGLPRVSIIIVGKRHHTRFYPVTTNQADKNSNTVNGTVVDRGVTEDRHWDFYLQAHSALKGTARPAHYFVILDEIFRARKNGPPTADVLEDLTHNLCYLFGRATKAVSVCPPAYYADLACERARRYLSGYYDASPAESIVSGETGRGPSENEIKIHPNLENSMFYI
ncbi:predicted protein [Uncinocarpus reesii 1704]|uniref:Piwi domain-containing protein n=1 Tax=Uncinocarpus reesii (strain UAMH 1704) TaxID=336963 RepID=C4JG78_UNCRE|nr:uncharacterized protein UREG_02476 [Uncinocarpus reesii 1704]EEP77627.1 predicted protein [Uncinocarpus reesii 1704]